MTRVVRDSALLCLAGILVASVAIAQVPAAVFSSVSNGRLAVEGTTGPGNGIPDLCTDGRCGNLTVTINDVVGAPLAGSIVTADFSGCPDINISCDQLTATTGQTYGGGHTVTGVTNALGQFTFRVQGAGAPFVATCGMQNCPGTNAGVACAVITASDVPNTGLAVPIGTVRVVAYDIDRLGVLAVSVANDVPKVFQEVINFAAFGASARSRDDYDFSGLLTINDVALSMQYALDQGLGTGSKETMHTGWSTWPAGGTPVGFCP